MLSFGSTIVGSSRSNGKRRSGCVFAVFVDSNDDFFLALPAGFSLKDEPQAHDVTFPRHDLLDVSTENEAPDLPYSCGFVLRRISSNVEINSPPFEYVSDVPAILAEVQIGSSQGFVSKTDFPVLLKSSDTPVSGSLIELPNTDCSSISIGSPCLTSGNLWGVVSAVDHSKSLVFASTVGDILRSFEDQGFRLANAGDFFSRRQKMIANNIGDRSKPASLVIDLVKNLLGDNLPREYVEGEMEEFNGIDAILGALQRIPEKLNLESDVTHIPNAIEITGRDCPTLGDLLSSEGRLSRIFINYLDAEIYELPDLSLKHDPLDSSVATVLIAAIEAHQLEVGREVA